MKGAPSLDHTAPAASTNEPEPLEQTYQDNADPDIVHINQYLEVFHAFNDDPKVDGAKWKWSKGCPTRATLKRIGKSYPVSAQLDFSSEVEDDIAPAPDAKGDLYVALDAYIDLFRAWRKEPRVRLMQGPHWTWSAGHPTPRQMEMAKRTWKDVRGTISLTGVPASEK